MRYPCWPAPGRPQNPPVPGPLANRFANRVLSVSWNGAQFRAQKSAAPLKLALRLREIALGLNSALKKARLH